MYTFSYTATELLTKPFRRRTYPLLTMAKSTGSPYHTPLSYDVPSRAVVSLPKARLEGRAQAVLLAPSRATGPRPLPSQRGAERGSKKSGGGISGYPGRMAGEKTCIYVLLSVKLTHPEFIDETVEPELKNRTKTRHASFTMLMSAPSLPIPRATH